MARMERYGRTNTGGSFSFRHTISDFSLRSLRPWVRIEMKNGVSGFRAGDASKKPNVARRVRGGRNRFRSIPIRCSSGCCAIGTYLYGRRLYETNWDAPLEAYPPERREFAHHGKIVFSRTLTGASTRRERDFDSRLFGLKRESEHDISIGGAELAGVALEGDLVGMSPVSQPDRRRRKAGNRLTTGELSTSRFGTGVIQSHPR
jgi:hypothetical protein